jgi:hypothetical protein
MINEELEHLLELDPIKAHDQIMQATRPPPVIVHKEYRGRQPPLHDNGEEPPSLPIDDDMIEALAQTLAETRIQLRDEFQSMVDDAMGPLTEQVAVMQGQMSASSVILLTTLLRRTATAPG